MFHYSLRVIDEPKMSEIRILNLCHKESILVDIYRQSLLKISMRQTKLWFAWILIELSLTTGPITKLNKQPNLESSKEKWYHVKQFRANLQWNHVLWKPFYIYIFSFINSFLVPKNSSTLNNTARRGWGRKSFIFPFWRQ